MQCVFTCLQGLGCTRRKAQIRISFSLDAMHTCLHCVFFGMQDERSNSWRIQAISLAPGSFESRKALPVAWRGLRDEELSGKCGIEGGVFVHMSGFIGGNKTHDGAFQMAVRALEIESMES